MDTYYIIYCHRNKINNKAYIGQTKNIKDRWCASHYKGCRLFYYAIQKYGWDNFQHIILKDNILTIEQANYWEHFYIQLFNTINHQIGYNLTAGGGQTVISESTKKLIKQHHADFSGEKHPMYGKHHSEETKQKMRQAKLGSPVSEETKRKISEKLKMGNNPRAKRVQCLETKEIFSCAKQAALKYGVDNSTLSKCAKGKTKTCAGLHWKYID